MDFELWWLFIILPVIFALGWSASRFDLRQWRQEQLDAPRAYFKGLNFLLNEQQDKAIDSFIEAVQYDPNTADLHFALGNLFRRRGEYERAVRVHQHLLGRADLPATERDRAQYALALDYLKAGLLDHAEQALRVLQKVPAYTADAREALLVLYERARDWPQAIEIACALDENSSIDFSHRISHYHCELALQAKQQKNEPQLIEELQMAQRIAPKSPRPFIELARHALENGNIKGAFEEWGKLLRVAPGSVALIAPELIKSLADHSVINDEWKAKALAILNTAYQQESSLDLLMAILSLVDDLQKRHDYVLTYLKEHPSVIASAELVKILHTQGKDQAIEPELTAVLQTLQQSARPLDRYRCISCGFEAAHYFWQCPGCQSWDSYPPKRIEEL